MSGRRILSILAVLVFFCGCFTAQTAQAQEKKTSVIIMPFNTKAAGKYAYLDESIRTMLSSRLAAKAGIQIRDYSFSPKELNEIKKFKNRESSGKIPARLNVDYIVNGSMYSVSKKLDLQVTFHPLQKNGKPLKFTLIAENEEQILPALDRLVDEINNKISKKVEKKKLHKMSGQEHGKPVQSETPKGELGFQTANPEKMYKKGIYSMNGISGESGAMQVAANGVRKSSPISMEMVAMGVGDLDGDGTKEIVLAGNGELRIFHFRDGRFFQIAKASLASRLKIQAMNLADLNHDGRDEIYICATDGENISSLIAEWNAKQGLHILYKEIPWYLRPLKIPGRGMVLAGQESGVGVGNLISPGIYELKMKKGSDSPVRGEMLPVPSQVNLFDFVFADLNGDGQVETVAIDNQEKLLVYDQGKTLLWVSSENFGGSTNFLGSGLKADNAVQTKIYLPTRLIAVDLYNDKKQEILVARNKKTSYDFLSNFRTYNGGFVSCMKWTGAAMQELWHTRTRAGKVVDYNLQLTAGANEALKTSSAIQGQKGSGGKQSAVLFVGQVPSSTFLNILLPKKSETTLFAYDIYLKEKTKGKE
jgi:hypothetical protein